MTVLLRNRRGVAGILFLVAVAGWAPAQTDKPAPRPLESLKNLPPGAIIVVCDDLNAGKQLAANLILLTPKQYQDMRDEIAQAKAKGRPEEVVPGECKLTGAVEGDVIRLHAEFKFVTERNREQVLLACRMGRPTAVALDGGLPVVHPTSRGLVVAVEKKGEHAASLDLEVSIGPKGDRGSERGFELDLPGAAVTNLDLVMPDSVAQAAVGVSTPDRSSPRLLATTMENGQRRLKEFLGPATSLEISWKGPVPVASGSPQRIAQGTINICVAEGQIMAEAEWKLKARGKPVSEWRLHVPKTARVMVKSPGGDDRPIADIESPSSNDKSLRVVRLRETTLDTITVLAQVELERGQGLIPIGPFTVEGADWQRGDILISTPNEIPLRITHRGLLSPRVVSPDELRRDKDIKAAFSYWSLPAPEKAGGGYPPILDILAESSRGSMEARVEYFLQRAEENWKLRTILHITPLSAGIETLTVQLPANYQLQRTTPRSDEPAYTIEHDSNSSVAEIKLQQRATRPFDLHLEGAYAPSPMSNPVSLRLIGLMQAQGRGPHKVVITLQENQEFGPSRDRDPAWEVERSRYNRQTWTADHLPQQIEFTWQTHRQEVVLQSEVDVTLNNRDGNALQRIWFSTGQSVAETRFHVPQEITGLEVLEGGEWNVKTRMVTLARGLNEKSPLRLKYSFSIRREPGDTTFTLPLTAPAQDIRCETKLRFICESPSLVELVGGPWEELPLESTRDGKRLASIVLRSERPGDAPTLVVRQGATLASSGLERALIRVSVNEQGQQSYHTSFVLNQSSARFLDIELPGPPAALNVRIEVDGLLATWIPIAEAASRQIEGDPQRIARVPLGGASRDRVMLDVWYQIAPKQLGSAQSWAWGLGALKTILYPPRLSGNAGQGSVRWHVTLPSDWVPLWDDAALPADLTWVWRGWLVGSRPSTSTADLEQWLDPSYRRQPVDDGETAYPSRTGWRADLEPLTIRHVPQQAWLLGCSVALLATASCLYYSRSNSFVLCLLLAAAVTGLLTIGIVWSGVLSAVLYGCEPGLAALVIIVAVQWLLYRRYRRQIAFLPSFKRVKTGGSVVTINGVNRPREPSTVDAPPPVASDQWATGGPSPSTVGRAQLPGSSKTKAPPG
jgi:hypothetical protein